MNSSRAIQALMLVFLPLCCFLSQAETLPKLKFTARLSALPASFQTVESLAGGGNAEAQLSGNQLRIAGEFVGLPGIATRAHLHLGPPGISGPAFATLTIDKAASGNIKGDLRLTEEQRRALLERGMYLQIHSESAPEGHLRGWFFQASK